MFGDLFDEEDKENDDSKQPTTSRNKVPDCGASPSSSRGPTRLCGLQNQGGTCYLNSLIQTLFLTPEFRGGILKLGRSELGYYDDEHKSEKKARKIPLQLQRLFSKLLLLDQDRTSTSDLTESFGWVGSQAVQQHDVQELNRILFSAVESSLIGTSGENLIKALYHGTSVTQVICQECHKVSEREEDFLDLQMVLTGCCSLEQSLRFCYIAVESLDGQNQYRCDTCNRLVNAIKSAKLRSLPPILTFSLLRFTYDLKTFDRIKETKKYVFPLTLDMREFCETSKDDDVYELYSVVIHRGSCHGGHYHAYIKDTQGLGVWSLLEENTVQCVDGGDDIDCSDPVELVSALLRKLDGGSSIDQLCQIIYTTIGSTWSGRYKKQYGSLSKFLKKHSDVFSFVHGKVGLLHPDRSHRSEADMATKQENKEKANFSGTSPDEIETPEASCRVEQQCWFDFNDKWIRCIEEDEIQKQFSGKESAYMLFYRKKNLQNDVTKDFPSSTVPQWLVEEMKAQNEELERSRFEYDKRLNQINVDVHLACDFTVNDGVLVRKQDVSDEVQASLTIDRRKCVSELACPVIEFCSEQGLTLPRYTIHAAKMLPAGLHLYGNLTERVTSSLMECGVLSGSAVFVWDGKQVYGRRFLSGVEHEPILLEIIYPPRQEDGEGVETRKAFPASTTLQALKKYASKLTGIKLSHIALEALTTKKGSSTEVRELTEEKNSETLKTLDFRDGQRLVVEERSQKTKSKSSLATQESEKIDSHLTLLVENRCTQSGTISNDDSLAYPAMPVTCAKNKTICELKRKIILSIGTTLSDDSCILRRDEGALGLGPPLYDHERVEELTEGTKLVLEHGSPLQLNQIALRYYVLAPGHDRMEQELIVDRTEDVGKCLRNICENACLEGTSWHLRKTNWFGETAAVLENEEASLEDEGIENGDTVVIEEGRIPPKGYIRLALWLVDDRFPEENAGGMLAWITSGLQGLLTRTPQHDEEYQENTLSPLGEVELSQEISLTDLKMHIMQTEQMKDTYIPTPEFLRVQEIVNGYTGRVLRKSEQTLRYLKLSSASKLSVQVLKQEESLGQSAILLNIKKRVNGTRTYERQKQIIFNPKEAATPSALRQLVCDSLGLKSDKMAMAKYIRQKFQWLVINDSYSNQNKRAKKTVNLRQAPFHLHDGDVIGVKETSFVDECDEDFSTAEDDEGRNRLRLIEEEKIRRRREKRDGGRPRQLEVELRIYVDDFS